mmetsp:Transcript_26450/g.25592  ORF Transcript_26450/g.25592 Transcript_26450/m.25592 type:complete len:86 (+) Transcript_26450:148-405(+)
MFNIEFEEEKQLNQLNSYIVVCASCKSQLGYKVNPQIGLNQQKMVFSWVILKEKVLLREHKIVVQAISLKQEEIKAFSEVLQESL